MNQKGNIGSDGNFSANFLQCKEEGTYSNLRLQQKTFYSLSSVQQMGSYNLLTATIKKLDHAVKPSSNVRIERR